MSFDHSDAYAIRFETDMTFVAWGLSGLTCTGALHPIGTSSDHYRWQFFLHYTDHPKCHIPSFSTAAHGRAVVLDEEAISFLKWVSAQVDTWPVASKRSPVL